MRSIYWQNRVLGLQDQKGWAHLGALKGSLCPLNFRVFTVFRCCLFLIEGLLFSKQWAGVPGLAGLGRSFMQLVLQGSEEFGSQSLKAKVTLFTVCAAGLG